MEFVDFTETNEAEGETWRFWLQWDGNQKELAALHALLGTDEDEENPEYELVLTPVSEDQVDTLVEYSQSGYMGFEQKIVGTFTCPESLGDYQRDLYKGGIRDFFVATPSGG